MIPENWFFIATSKSLDVNRDTPQWKWFNEKFTVNFGFIEGYYYDSNGKSKSTPKAKEKYRDAGFVEISFDDFLKYVVKEEVDGEEDMSYLKPLLEKLNII